MQIEKKVKPQDLIRLYDSVIENCQEMLELPGAVSNEDLKLAYETKAEYYRAFRFSFCRAKNIQTFSFTIQSARKYIHNLDAFAWQKFMRAYQNGMKLMLFMSGP